jgi:hypothetical protein
LCTSSSIAFSLLDEGSHLTTKKKTVAAGELSGIALSSDTLSAVFVRISDAPLGQMVSEPRMGRAPRIG